MPMPSRRSQLPPLDYLIAFEAAATLGGFTAAADQLNLSQAAVSRKIRLLELNLGELLFARGHRSVKLTPSGRTYLRSVRKALDEIGTATVALRKGKLRSQVNLAATQSVTALWLMPRLPQICRDLPHLEISLVSSDEDETCLRGDFDLVILRGAGRWTGHEAQLLMGEEVFPVCSAAYAERLGLGQITDLSRCNLIEVTSQHDEWMNWHSWFSEVGETGNAEPNQLTFNTYALAVQAACDGMGVALGWRHLVDRQLASGTLIRPLSATVRTGSGYFLLSRRGHHSEAAQALRKWLFSSVDESNSGSSQA